MFESEIDMSKVKGGEGENFFDTLTDANSSPGKCSKIFCFDGVWLDFNYDPPKVLLDNHTTI